MYLRVLAALAIAATLALTGCAQIDEQLAPKPVVVTQEATAAVAAAPVNGDLAEETPADLPLWPQANVLSSEAEEGTYTLELSTADTYDDVLNGVAVGFERGKWSVAVEDASVDGERSSVLTVGTEAYDGLVTISEDDSATVTIEYILTPAE